jgi:hypothetical protein
MSLWWGVFWIVWSSFFYVERIVEKSSVGGLMHAFLIVFWVWWIGKKAGGRGKVGKSQRQ